MGKAKKAPTAKQLAARARFAARFGGTRGAVGMGPGFGGGFRSARRTAHDVVSQFKHGSWGERALGFIAGYFLPQALDKTGIGLVAYGSVPQYRAFVDAMWNGTAAAGLDNTPWANGGTVGVGKLVGGALLAKDAWKYRETGVISKAKMNWGLPFELGLLLDGPELHPFVEGGVLSSGPGPFAAPGGVTW